MSIESLTLALHHSRAAGTTKLVLLGIANHDGDGGAWPSVRTLAKYAQVDGRAVKRALRKLEELGEIRTHRQAGGLAGMADFERPNRYDFLVCCPPGCDRTSQHRVVETTPGGVVETTPGGVVETTPGGVVETTPKPSYEPSLEPSNRGPVRSSSHQRGTRDQREGTRASDPQHRDGHPKHQHEPNALAKCERLVTDRRLPLDPGELLSWSYRLGEGNPWDGTRYVDRATDHQIDNVNNPRRVLLARLRDLTPGQRRTEVPA